MKKFFFSAAVSIALAGCQPAKIEPSLWVAGVVAPEIPLNGEWKFTTKPPEHFWENTVSVKNWADIEVPGEAMMQGFAIRHYEPFVYKKQIDIPPDFRERTIQLRFDGVYSFARVWANGHFVREHSGGFTRWECDITPYVEAGKKAWITVEITDRPDEISYASGYAKHQIGGILRDVYLVALPDNYPDQVNIETDLDENYEQATLRVFGKVKNPGTGLAVHLELFDTDGKAVVLQNPSVELNDNAAFDIANPVANPDKWDAEHPNIYRLQVSFSEEGKRRWQKTYGIGFREVEISGNKLLVNGAEVKLRGANRHDIHPLLGRVSSPAYEERDVQLAKEANMNFIRTSHYPPTENFLRLCDEYGLYVESESAVCFVGSHRTEEYQPGASQSNPDFTERYLSQLREMVETHRNHPSVIIWSIGNENAFGTNFKLSYDWVRQNDRTRPVVFSYPGHVPGNRRAYDILSMHYPGIDGNMDQIGKQTNAFGYAEMPVIFDEWAHVACYNNFTVREDPNIRSFWGQSLDSMWMKVFAADGGLGGAIWGMIDETFLLPDTLPGFNRWWGKIDKNVIPAEYAGHAVGYGEWGIVDTWRRKKPEFWNTRKAYSPVRVLQTTFDTLPPGDSLLIPIHNRFDHTDFSELTVKWRYKKKTRTLPPLALAPHAKGDLFLPLEAWEPDEDVELYFYNAWEELVDQYILRLRPPAAPPEPSDEVESVEIRAEEDRLVVVCPNDVQIVFDTASGLIQTVKGRGGAINCAGPFLNLRTKGEAIMYAYHQIVDHAVNWRRQSFSYQLEGPLLVATTLGDYDDLPGVTFKTTVFPDGTFAIDYQVANVPDEYIRELGLKFLLDDVFESLTWRRDAYWSVYPKGHLSAHEGKAALYSSSLNTYRQEPEKEWNEDAKSFYYDGTGNETRREQLTHIARATKEHIRTYDLFKKGRGQIGVDGDGELGCRIAKTDQGLTLFVNNHWDYVDLSWGNYQRDIKLAGEQRGSITLRIK